MRHELVERADRLGPLLSKCAIAVNEEYAGDATPIALGDRVAVLPPVSGG